MSTKSSPTVSITLIGPGATDFTKSYVAPNTISRTSDDGNHVLRHTHQLTLKGRKRSVVSLQQSDGTDPSIKGTCTVTIDSPDGNTTMGLNALKGMQDFLTANTAEEVDLLASGHNYG